MPPPAPDAPPASIRLRFDLAPFPSGRPPSCALPSPALPRGLAFAPFDPAALADLHALLAAAYSNGFGDVGAFDAWRAALLADVEYAPDLVFLVRDTQGALVAGAQCWTPGFIKDIAVRDDWRGRGVGQALIARILTAFSARGAPHVDLKVMPANAPARALYAGLGFHEAG